MSPGSGSGCRSSRQGRSKSRCRPPTSSDQLESGPCPASRTGWPTGTVVPGQPPYWSRCRWARAELGAQDAHRPPLLSAIAALIGALIGGTASLLAAIIYPTLCGLLSGAPILGKFILSEPDGSPIRWGQRVRRLP